MPVTLRPPQVQLERDIYAAWQSGANTVMPVSATGSGKTVVIAKLVYDEPGGSIAIAHRQELVSQISIAMARNGVRHRIVGAKKGSPLIRIISALQIAELGYSFFDPNAKTGVGGVDTIIRMDPQDPIFKQSRLGLQDEGHHVLKANKWGKAYGMFNQTCRWLLPTATPLRADGKGLGRHADGLVDRMVLAPTMRAYIDMGYLTDYRIFAPPSDIDLTGVTISTTTGDFNADQLRKAVRASHIVGDVVGHYLRIAPGKLGVTFAVDIDTATSIAQAFRTAGVPAEVVTSHTPDALRAQILRRFKNREILQLVNVDLFGEGFDLPAIEVVSFARPTESFSLYSQQFGRALRLMLEKAAYVGYDNLTDAGRRALIAASSKPVAIIIDHVNNVMRHGLPDRNIKWSLDRRDKRATSESDEIPTRRCTGCFKDYERFYKCCPYCKTYPPVANRSAPEFVDGDLLELDASVLEAMRNEIDRVDGPALVPKHLQGSPAEIAITNNHWARSQAQYALRNRIAWWAGVEQAQGRGESESYKRFYWRYGFNVAEAQSLGAKEAAELTTRIDADLAQIGIDGTINAAAYFTGE